MDVEKEERIGLYEPNEEEQENCQELGIACDFGICSECVIGSGGSNV